MTSEGGSTAGVPCPSVACRSKYTRGTYSHDSVHQAALLFGTLQPLHGPPVHGGGNRWVVNIQQSEACHVDPAVAVRLQIQGKQILQGAGGERFKLSITPSALWGVRAPRQQLTGNLGGSPGSYFRLVSPIKQLQRCNFSHQSCEEEMVVLGHHSHGRQLENKTEEIKRLAPADQLIIASFVVANKTKIFACYLSHKSSIKFNQLLF